MDTQPVLNSAPAHERTIGPVLWTLIIVVLLIIASLYFWGKKLNNDEKARSQSNATKEAQVSQEEFVSIEKELKATNINHLDASVRTINKTQ
jgi:hypothetical protein